MAEQRLSDEQVAALAAWVKGPAWVQDVMVERSKLHALALEVQSSRRALATIRAYYEESQPGLTFSEVLVAIGAKEPHP